LERQNPEEVSNGKITKDRLKGSESPRAGKAKKAKKGTKTRENLADLERAERRFNEQV
jgi:hypothetical protein